VAAATSNQQKNKIVQSGSEDLSVSVMMGRLL